MTTVKVMGTTAFVVGCRKKTRALAAASVPLISMLLVISAEGVISEVAVTVASAAGASVELISSVEVIASVVVASVEVISSVEVMASDVVVSSVEVTGSAGATS